MMEFKTTSLSQHCSTIAEEFVSACASSVSYSISKKEQQSTKQMDLLRQHYKKAFESDDPKGILTWVADHLLERVVLPVSKTEDKKMDTSSYMIWCNTQCYIPGVSRLSFSVGRFSECDVLSQSDTCSRLHSLNVIIPGCKQIAIIDVGSYNGIQTLQRSDASKECLSSSSDHRRVLLFDLEETFSLQMGEEMVVFNAKLCLHCFKKESAIMNKKCGHVCVCSDCMKEHECLLCCKK